MKAAGALLVLLLRLCVTGAWWDGNVFQSDLLDEMKQLKDSLVEQGRALEEKLKSVDEVKELRDLVSDLQVEMANTKHEMEEMAAELTASQKQVELLHTRLNTTEDKIEVLHTRLSTTEDTVEVIDTRLSTTEDQIEVLHTRLSTTEDTVEVHHTKLNATEDQADVLNTRLTTTEDQIDVLHTRLKTTEDQIEVLHTGLSTTEVQVANLETEGEEMAAELTASQKQVELLRTRLNTTEDHLEVHHTKLNTTEVQIDVLHTRLSTTEDWTDVLHTRLNITEDQIDVLHTRLSTTEDKVDNLETESKAHGAQLSSVETRLNVSENKVQELSILLVNLDCGGIYKRTTQSGVYTIYPTAAPVKVYCDMDTDGGKWTVIQRRVDGTVDFYRPWAQYKAGFGDASGEYWLGLENMHLLTKDKKYELRVDMEDFDGNTAYALYSSFSVGSEADGYKLQVAGFRGGEAGDSLKYNHNGMKFSTFDKDQDPYSGNCARMFSGAFWFGPGCHHVNINGAYQRGTTTSGVNWYHWKRNWYSMKAVAMKIRHVP